MHVMPVREIPVPVGDSRFKPQVQTVFKLLIMGDRVYFKTDALSGFRAGAGEMLHIFLYRRKIGYTFFIASSGNNSLLGPK